MRNRFYIIFLFFLIQYTKTKAQFNNFDFVAPVDIPMFLSGNFGEIRSNHFHTGIDIKTQGEPGKKVYAISNGYVSRIKIQCNGYGKALYITHNNGYTSVYGHLDKFRDDIKEYTESEQYRNKSFEIDLYLDKTTFKVSKGELIAFSGNSGGSSGPHLHFEIRDQNQRPLNVLKFPININDDLPPVFKSLMLYPIEDAQINKNDEKLKIDVIKHNGEYSLVTQEITVNGKIGFGAEVYDYLSDSHNRCGVYSLELEIDGALKNQFLFDRLTFGKLRYINAHIDYYEKALNNINVHRLYKLPNNQLDIYKYENNNGIIDINDTLKHNVKIIARDAYGNFSTLSFMIKGSEEQPFTENKKEQNTAKKMYFNQTNSYILNDIKVFIPENSLYNDINFNYIKTNGKQGFNSAIHHINDNKVPLHKQITIAIKPDSLDEKYYKKACIAMLNEDDELTFIGGEWKNGFIETTNNEFGKYTVVIDSISPQILPINFINASNIKELDKITILIKDEFSGIKEYVGYIDGKWALFDYDKKNDLITHILDDKRFDKNKWHELKIIASDNLDNKNELNVRFFW